MRNPIRLKNLRARFWPAYLAGALAIWLSAPTHTSLRLGVPLIAVGLLIRAWGAGHLVKNDLLTRTGPYAFVRHPFYLGSLCIGAGFAVSLGGWSTMAALGVLLPWFFAYYFPRKERVEAERLHALYGVEYDRYRAAVPPLWPAWPWRRRVDGGGERWRASRYDENNELGTLIACLAGLVLVAGWVWLRG